MFCLQNIFGQSANFSLDGTNYTVAKNIENHTFDASWRLGRLQFVFKAPSKIRNGKFDNITLVTVGREIKKYPIGFEAKEIVDKTGEETGCGSISVSYEGNRDRIVKSSDKGYNESSSGFITISKIESNKVSGNFVGSIDGTKVSGTFENIEVKSW